MKTTPLLLFMKKSLSKSRILRLKHWPLNKKENPEAIDSITSRFLHKQLLIGLIMAARWLRIIPFQKSNRTTNKESEITHRACLMALIRSNDQEKKGKIITTTILQ